MLPRLKRFDHQVSINYDDLKFYEEIGRGAYGKVHRAVWEEHEVAVKVIDIGCGVVEYKDEIQQLSNLTHENIIQLFGTSMHEKKVFIIMEFADCGSLYDLLHPTNEEYKVDYSLGHVIRWSLQCAKAVGYLHSLKPMVVHRDLKTPNMLVIQYGRVVKICDFGTATQIKTEMTQNKGSAAWMAPEVFEGKRYTEKCDVYSFGIILWETLSRKKPFDEIGAPPFRILWAVHKGTRPPPIKGTPPSLMKLIEKCWAKRQMQRPSFSDIVKYLCVLDEFTEGADETLYEDSLSDEDETLHCDEVKVADCVSPTWENIFPPSDGFQDVIKTLLEDEVKRQSPIPS